MTQGNNGLKPFVWIMGTETKKTRTGKEENPINEERNDRKDMIEFYVRLFLNRLRELFSITKLYLKCLDTKILVPMTTCESRYRFTDTNHEPKFSRGRSMDREPSTFAWGSKPQLGLVRFALRFFTQSDP